MRESVVMKELHEIRVKHHEYTKNMPVSEKIRNIN
jgi:hypothetical protein